MKELPTPTFELSPIALPRGSLHLPSDRSEVRAENVAVGQRTGIEVSWAKNLDEVREAQRLRHLVFATEMGAQLKASIPGHDIDLFDDFCEHLLVRDAQSQAVVGTYRVLTPTQAKRVGSFYTDTEFDLDRKSTRLNSSHIPLSRMPSSA